MDYIVFIIVSIGRVYRFKRTTAKKVIKFEPYPRLLYKLSRYSGKSSRVVRIRVLYSSYSSKMYIVILEDA